MSNKLIVLWRSLKSREKNAAMLVFMLMLIFFAYQCVCAEMFVDYDKSKLRYQQLTQHYQQLQTMSSADVRLVALCGIRGHSTEALNSQYFSQKLEILDASDIKIERIESDMALSFRVPQGSAFLQWLEALACTGIKLKSLNIIQDGAISQNISSITNLAVNVHMILVLP